MPAFEVRGPTENMEVHWVLQRQYVDIGELGRLMINGWATIGGKSRAAIWNILDWRDPEVVMKKCAALLACGWDQVWVFAPGIFDELKGLRKDGRVEITERSISPDNAEELLGEVFHEQLRRPKVVAKPHLPRPKVEKFAPTTRDLQEERQKEEAERLRIKVILSRPSIKPLDTDVDSGWGQEVKDFLEKRKIAFDPLYRFLLRDASVPYYTVDFYIRRSKLVIDPHRDDKIDDNFKNKLRAFRKQYPKYEVILVTKQSHDELLGDVCDYWAFYDPPEFEDLKSILRLKGCVS